MDKIRNPTKHADYTQKIPFNIFQTMETTEISPNMKKATESWTQMNPEYNWYFFTHDDRKEFISKHFDARALNAYNRLVPGAYRADLWRLCVLYVKGGVYVDIPTLCKEPLKNIIPSDVPFVTARDRNHHELYNCFIASVPRHPFLKRTILDIVHNVENNYYGDDCLAPTGPGAFGKAVNKCLERDQDATYKLGAQTVNNHNFYILEHIPEDLVVHKDGQTIFLTRYDEDDYNKSRKYFSGKHYGELWGNKSVYR